MSKKNKKIAIQRRLNEVKKEFIINSKKKERKRELKSLEVQVKRQLLNLSFNNQTKSKGGIQDSNMSTKKRNAGINFSRFLNGTTYLRSRDKKIVQRLLKRKNNLVEVN